MSAEAALLTKTWFVGRYRCTLTVGPKRPGQLSSSTIEWEPSVPRRLSESQMRAYRRGRDNAIAELAQTMGGTIAVLEL